MIFVTESDALGIPEGSNPIFISYTCRSPGLRAQPATLKKQSVFPDTIFRVNISPFPFTVRNSIELERIAETFLKSYKDYQNLIIGTGILPPNVPSSNILAARNQI